MTFHVTAVTGALAAAAGRIARLLPARALASLVVRSVGGDRVELSASDGDLSVRLSVPAMVHEDGTVAISRRAAADTLGALDSPEVRLVAEGSRLAIRTPGARFALPLLDPAAVLPAPSLPVLSGTVDAAAFRAAVLPVAGAASREHALPIFTGVRLRSEGGRLSLVATDRFRMASAVLPWRPARGAEPVDVLVPAASLAEIARPLGTGGPVGLHAAGDRLGVVFDGASGAGGGSALLASLGSAFPDRQIDRLLEPVVECVIEVPADELAGAVDRAAPYGGPHARVLLRTGDGAVVVHGSDPLAGESEETVKAAVRGDRVTRAVKARLLLDALRPFGGRTASIGVQAGLRAVVVSAEPGADGVQLRYLVVPMRDS